MTNQAEQLYIPFVGAIIERENGGEKQVLIQIRDKASDPKYSGSIEIPGGKMRAGESIFETVRREVSEETGLTITFISGEKSQVNYPNRGNVSTVFDPFCVTQMENGPFIGFIFLCKAMGTPLNKTNESKDAQWIDNEALQKIVNEAPEKIYTPFLGPLKKYCSVNF